MVGHKAITNIGANKLQSIGGDLDIQDCPSLQKLSFPLLTNVTNLYLQNLASLDTLGFVSGLSRADTVHIQNTSLPSLEGIDLASEADITFISENRLLQDISLRVRNVSQSLSIGDNGDGVILNLNNLVNAQNLTFWNCPHINMLSLVNVIGSLGISGNSIEALLAPNLITIGGTLAINDNWELTNILLPLLETITGGMQIQRNQLMSTVGLPSLQTVGGATELYGSFTRYVYLLFSSPRYLNNQQETHSL